MSCVSCGVCRVCMSCVPCRVSCACRVPRARIPSLALCMPSLCAYLLCVYLPSLSLSPVCTPSLWQQLSSHTAYHYDTLFVHIVDIPLIPSEPRQKPKHPTLADLSSLVVCLSPGLSLSCVLSRRAVHCFPARVMPPMAAAPPETAPAPHTVLAAAPPAHCLGFRV